MADIDDTLLLAKIKRETQQRTAAITSLTISRTARSAEIDSAIDVIRAKAIRTAKAITILEATTDETSATVQTLSETTAAADAAFALTISSLTASINTQLAAIQAQITTVSSAVVDASGATSTLSTKVRAQFNGVTASVTQEATARASADGNLSGNYALTVTAGNVVTGMTITSATGPGGTISDVIFNAANFKIYNGTSGVAPFQVIAGTVRITGALVLAQADIPALDWATQVTGTGKPANNADVTLAAVNGGLAVTGGGITLTAGGAIMGGCSAYATGTGFFLGYSGGQYKFFVGNPAGNYISWDGSTWTVNVPTTVLQCPPIVGGTDITATGPSLGVYKIHVTKPGGAPAGYAINYKFGANSWARATGFPFDVVATGHLADDFQWYTTATGYTNSDFYDSNWNNGMT